MTILKSGGGFIFGICLLIMNHKVISNLLFRDQFSSLLKLQISRVQNKYFHLVFTVGIQLLNVNNKDTRTTSMTSLWCLYRIKSVQIKAIHIYLRGRKKNHIMQMSKTKYKQKSHNVNVKNEV